MQLSLEPGTLVNPQARILDGKRILVQTNNQSTVTAISTVMALSCETAALPPAPPPTPLLPPQPPLAPPLPPPPAGPRGCWTYQTWNLAWGDLTHAVTDDTVYMSVRHMLSLPAQRAHARLQQQCALVLEGFGSPI
jgi:hypothetical protein